RSTTQSSGPGSPRTRRARWLRRTSFKRLLSPTSASPDANLVRVRTLRTRQPGPIARARCGRFGPSGQRATPSAARGRPGIATRCAAEPGFRYASRREVRGGRGRGRLGYAEGEGRPLRRGEAVMRAGIALLLAACSSDAAAAAPDASPVDGTYVCVTQQRTGGSCDGPLFDDTIQAQSTLVLAGGRSPSPA